MEKNLLDCFNKSSKTGNPFDAISDLQTNDELSFHLGNISGIYLATIIFLWTLSNEFSILRVK